MTIVNGMTPEPPEDQERINARLELLLAFHHLNPRIPDLEVADCHCNLLAEVALDALNLPEHRQTAHRAGRESVARDIEDKIAELYRQPFRLAAVGIEYVSGMHAAAEIATRSAPSHRSSCRDRDATAVGQPLGGRTVNGFDSGMPGPWVNRPGTICADEGWLYTVTTERRAPLKIVVPG
jgi:hypothetical protein